MPEDRIISIGFLTRADLDRLGPTFMRCFPVSDDAIFADLLAKLDEIEVEPLRDGIIMRPDVKG